MSLDDAQLLKRSILGETRTLQPLNIHSNVYEASRMVKSGTGILYGFTVYNSKLSSQWIQVFDAQTLPADGAIPAAIFTVATIANLGVNWLPGRTFLNGCVICNSTTGPTKTIGAADCWFDVQFL